MNISVITPAYNAATTVAGAIDSVRAQTVPKWELIVVNDGSTDATVDILAALAEQDSRIRILNRSNGGEAAARNTGIAEARYDWLLFLDADDWILPAYMERMARELAADPKLDAVHCGWARIAFDGTKVVESYRPPAGDLFPVLARRAAFPVHACIVRKSLVEAAGGFDPGLRKSPDWDLWQRIARTGANFGSVPETLAHYRMTPHSASLEAEQMLLDGLTVLKRGHAPDPRVPNPLPEYAGGLTGSTVESQEFYLLCWCAGLLLGSGQDARCLLPLVGSDRYPGLYADAIAQCIFDSAMLPSCHPSQDWEGLWPGLRNLIESFLTALEAQSGAKGLASQALIELKKLVLRSSLDWSPVIQEMDELRRTNLQLQAESDRWHQQVAAEYQEKVAFARDLEDTRHVNEALSADQGALRSALNDMSGRFDALHAENKDLLNGLEASRARVNVLDEGQVSLVSALEDSRARVNELEEGQSSMLSILEDSRARVNILEERQTSLVSALDGSRAQVSELERGQTSLVSALEESRARVNELEEGQKSLVSALDGSRAQVSELQQGQASLSLALEESRARVNKLEEGLKSLVSALDGSRARVSALEAGQVSLVSELEGMRGRLDVLSAERLELETALGAMRERFAGVLAIKEQLQASLEDLRRRAAALAAEKAALEALLLEARERSRMLEADKVGLTSELSEARERIAELVTRYDFMDSELNALRRRAETLEQELEKWRQSSDERAYLIEEIQQEIWVRAGLWMGLIKRRDVVPASLELSPRPAPDGLAQLNWEYRIEPGNDAYLIYPRGDREMVRIGITKAKTKNDWDIQLNRSGLKVRGGEQYILGFRGRAARLREIGVGFSKGDAPWSNLGLYTKVRLTPEWQTFRKEFVAAADDDNGRIHFDLGGMSIGVDLTSVALQKADLPTGEIAAPAEGVEQNGLLA